MNNKKKEGLHASLTSALPAFLNLEVIWFTSRETEAHRGHDTHPGVPKHGCWSQDWKPDLSGCEVSSSVEPVLPPTIQDRRTTELGIPGN
jgi:hypothetical protein